MTRQEGDEWRDLPPQLQHTFLTGRLTQSDVLIERDMTRLLEQLRREQRERDIRIPKRKDYAPVLAACRSLLPGSTLERAHPDALPSAMRLLDIAEDIHERRNRFVHDMWGLVDGASGTFAPWPTDHSDLEKMHGAWDPTNFRTLDDMESLCDEYLALSAKIFQLGFLISAVQAGEWSERETARLEWIRGERTFPFPLD